MSCQRTPLGLLLLLLLSLTGALRADPGVLIPRNAGDRPDPSILSLDRMDVDVSIDRRFARVRSTQLFRNHTGGDLEAEFIFFLPAGTGISDFAIWEDGVRIPGVILERARARQHYENLTANKIDPGLLEKSRHAEQANTFSVKVYPVPAFGSKRLELEYSQELDQSSGRVSFVYPLKPARYRDLVAASLRLSFEVKPPSPLDSFSASLGALKASLVKADPDQYSGVFTAVNHSFVSDFVVEMGVRRGGTRTAFLTYRDPSRVRKDLSPFGAGKLYSDPRGYFLCDVSFDLASDRAAGAASPARGGLAVCVLFDCSLSMQWEKLDAAFQVAAGLLHRLEAADRFSLIAFNDRASAAPGGLAAAGQREKAAALDWLKTQTLSGGTDLAGAMATGLRTLEAAPAGLRRVLALVSDGHATNSPLGTLQILKSFFEANTATRARVMAFGVGSDTNRPLLEKLASSSEGQFSWAAETEDVSVPLRGFLDRLGQPALRNLALSFAVPDNVEMVYPGGPRVGYDLCSYRFVGRYKGPLASTGAAVSFESPSGPVRQEMKVELPEVDRARPHLARIWARERVDFLLDRIAAEGEKEEWIEEIIALAREHKFVTPYTSFLAAPRALLRPRVIKPGDPVLRVKTPEDIVSVAAIFPFGLTKALAFLADEKLWETRFLAPRDMADGAYSATLVLTDREGRKYLEEKSFVIDSKPPSLRVALPAGPARAGQPVLVSAFADADTRRISARLLDQPPVELRYDPRAHASTALLPLPAGLLPGAYALRLTAEDFAHNISFAEATVNVQ